MSPPHEIPVSLPSRLRPRDSADTIAATMKRLALTSLLIVLCTPLGSAVAGAKPQRYVVDPARSRMELVGVKAGAEARAVFKKFSATIDFAPDALTASKCDVLIDVASIDSQEPERDAAILGPDLLDVARFPTAHFVTRSFGLSERGFSAFGSLTLHGVTKDLAVLFSFSDTDEGPALEGKVRIKRLDFGVGQGEWRGFQDLADSVTIKFKLLLSPKT
jgi:polyisoprenoid-binding protein YceI